MKINSITPYTQQNNIGFNGKIIAKGNHWTPFLENAFINSSAVKDLATGKNKVIGRLITSRAKEQHGTRHYAGQKLYKLSIEVKNPHASLLEKIKGFLGLNRHCINTHRHSEDGLIIIMKNINTRVLKKLVKAKD